VRNTDDRSADDLGLRPMTARSVLLSTLLGLDPPVQPAARLVETARLFGIGESAARVALSRMAAAGEVVAEDGRYRLTGRLLDRQRRQESGRHPPTEPWSGQWHVAVVTAERRSAAHRAELRGAMTAGRVAEWREGVWTRPDNLPAPPLPAEVAGHCAWLTAAPVDDAAALASALWDLGDWAARARRLDDRLRASRPAVDGGDTDTLAPGFILSATVLRHLAADPLLPAALRPAGWPGDELRSTYDGWDAAYRRLLAEWHRSRAQ
jgi:phenylacetic acid degradation operon negative regulatory protein